MTKQSKNLKRKSKRGQALPPARGSADFLSDESAECSMVGEMYDRIIKADASCESASLEWHALEALQTPAAKALKQGLCVDLGYRRAFLALAALKGIRPPNVWRVVLHSGHGQIASAGTPEKAMKATELN